MSFAKNKEDRIEFGNAKFGNSGKWEKFRLAALENGR